MIVLKFLVLLGGVVAARTSNGDYCHSCLNVNVDLGDPEHCMNVTKQTEVAEMDRGCYQMTGTYKNRKGKMLRMVNRGVSFGMDCEDLKSMIKDKFEAIDVNEKVRSVGEMNLDCRQCKRSLCNDGRLSVAATAATTLFFFGINLYYRQCE